MRLWLADWVSPRQLATRMFPRLLKRRRPVPPVDQDRGGIHPWEGSYPVGLNWRTEIEVRPVPELLDAAVATYPERVCVDFLGRRYSYADIGALVERAAHGLRRLGVDKGARVALLLPNCPYSVIAYYAVLKAGGTVVNLNPLYAEREIERLIRDSGARILITVNLRFTYDKIARRLADGNLERVVVGRMRHVLPFPDRLLFAFLRRREVASIPNDGRHVAFDRLVAQTHKPFDPPPIDPRVDVAVLQYTSGTNGALKGAMLTHANIYANVVQGRLWGLPARPGGERALGVLPLFHAFGMTAILNLGIHLGATLILLPRFKIQEVLKAIDRQKPTVLMGVPTMYSAINSSEKAGDCDFSSLGLCISGGAPLPPAVQRRFQALTGCAVIEGYGLTEATAVCTINPLDHPAKNRQGSVGLPMPGTLVEITDPTDPDRVLETGQPGEIRIAGPQVMAGYWNRPEETAEALRGGRLRTGDFGYLDEDGYLHIVGRLKPMILVGGFNVYPRMVEAAILSHPAVAEAAVCGLPDEHHGEVVKAYVVRSDDLELTAVRLRQFLRQYLAPFEMPRIIEFCEVLPPSPAGVVYTWLRREETAAQETATAADETGDPSHRPAIA